MKIAIGIDMAKDSFVASVYDGNKHIVNNYDNNKAGHKKFMSFIGKYEVGFCIMEPVSTYHLNLAEMLYEKKYLVCVVNPTIIKYFKSMRMLRVKTDAIDAKMMAEYAFNNEKECKELEFRPRTKEQKELMHILKMLEDFQESKNEYVKRLKALQFDKSALKIIERFKATIEYLNKQIKELKKELREKIRKTFAREAKLLMSIPGIGQIVSASIIAIFGNFESFGSAKEAVCFVGLNPKISQSGKSLKTKVSKIGNCFLRTKFFLAALSASQHNKQCMELYNRLINEYSLKGKQALVAVANKLCRQAFAVLKYGVAYNPNYVEEVYLPNFKNA